MKLPKGVVMLVVALAFKSSLAENKNSGSKDVCQELFYPVYPQDYQSDIHSSNPQLHKDLDFEFPFYGFRYNYTRISMNGYLEFTDPPETYTYPLKFPRNYPEENDPAFIGPFYSKTRIGKRPEGSCVEGKDGVHFRVESNLQDRTDAVAVETRQRVQADIRGGDLVAVGAREFDPKHVIITTWLGMSFAGGIENSTNITNSFQAVVATDEVATYAIFNYDDVNWTSHTEAGGDSATGLGGIAAFVGFNAGRGAGAFEYQPYSQKVVVQILSGTGCANGFDSRHIFRIDRNIMPGACSMDMDFVCRNYLQMPPPPPSSH